MMWLTVTVALLLVLQIGGTAAHPQSEVQISDDQQNKTDVVSNGPIINNIYVSPGEAGHPGERGEPGPAGPPGDTGPVGPPGDPGSVGYEGPQGLPGPPGEKGIQGKDGIPGLVGPQGEHGVNGLPGEAGPRGQKGVAGSRGQRGPPGPTPGGLTYTRWGRTSCPSTSGTTLIYDGIMVGSRYNEGGGSNYLCLPKDPEYLQYTSARETYRALLYGVEYEFGSVPVHSNLNNHNGPCAVCYTPNRIAKLMIPAKFTCPSTWTREYYGYLMATRKGHGYRYEFICMDNDLESVPGSQPNTAQSPAALYFTESTCNGVPCPPYVAGREVTCAVCSK